MPFNQISSELVNLFALCSQCMYVMPTYEVFHMYKIPPLSQMLTPDPGDSDECYACKLLEVMIIHCHHSLIQVGGAGTQVGGV